KKAAINIQNVLPMSPNVCNLCVQPIHLPPQGGKEKYAVIRIYTVLLTAKPFVKSES
ncbi:MAG: hypothetical protein HW396_1758, partial [Candidatus Dadabacteria bacterium]|nr:hypothetical protein [Candidatus Dadabacteria bacterium]